MVQRQPVALRYEAVLSKALGSRVLRTLYVGHGVNTAREATFLGTYFGLYEHSVGAFRQLLPEAYAVPAAGGVAGAAGWFLSLPLDCVKQNIQGQRLEARSSSAGAVAVAAEARRPLLCPCPGLQRPSGVPLAVECSSMRFAAPGMPPDCDCAMPPAAAASSM